MAPRYSCLSSGGGETFRGDQHEWSPEPVSTGNEKHQARESLARAKAIIEATGYHRRDPDVAEIERQLNE